MFHITCWWMGEKITVFCAFTCLYFAFMIITFFFIPGTSSECSISVTLIWNSNFQFMFEIQQNREGNNLNIFPAYFFSFQEFFACQSMNMHIFMYIVIKKLIIIKVDWTVQIILSLWSMDFFRYFNCFH